MYRSFLNRLRYRIMLYDRKARADCARAYFMQGFNCCQSVAMAFSDVFQLPPEKVAAIASGFGGGIARMREVCGCVSGMTLVAGAALPSTDPDDKQGRTANYSLVQSLAGDFRSLQGSIVCRDLLGIRQESSTGAGSAGPDGPGTGIESPVPSDRTPQYYHSRKCADFVACAADILADQLSKI